MKERSNDWLVGVSIIVTMVGMVAATLWLQQADLGSQRRGVTARFRDVGNMQVGNAVVIRGVKAGRVRALTLAAQGWVLVDLDLDEGIVLPSDPVVLLQSSSLFGEWQATVTGRDAAPQISDVMLQLDDVAGAPDGALPGAVLPDIAQLTTVAGGIAGNVASVAERVRTAFDDSAARELRTSIRNFSTASGDLARVVRLQSRNLDSMAAHVRIGVEDLTATSASLRRTVARVDSATEQGEIRTIISETERAAGNLRVASERIDSLTRALQSAERSLRGVVGKADSVLGKVDRGEGSLGLLVNDPSLYRNTDSLLVDLRTLINDFRKDPKKYFALRVF
jgi:phospholipid/cholesterol/gamma-HCH transport system substrate-binding protein